jgi:uncharacterized membrane protein YphA (DoxX/SURF4 family)
MGTKLCDLTLDKIAEKDCSNILSGDGISNTQDMHQDRRSFRKPTIEIRSLLMLTLFGIFLILHGLVHIFYFGHSRRLFELQPDMVWPDGAWAFSRLLGEQGTRRVASVLYAIATLGLVVAGAAVLLQMAWWRSAGLVAAAFSGAIIFLFWDGKFKALDNQGGIGLLINVAIVAGLLLLG